MSVTIDGELVDLEQNGPYSATITDDWELTVPDVIHVKVQPGTGSRDLAAELVEAEKDYGRLCSQGSVRDLDEARQKAEERRDAERLRSGAIKTIKQDLDDLTPDVLAQKLEGLTRRIDAYPVERPEARLFRTILTKQGALPRTLRDWSKIAGASSNNVRQTRMRHGKPSSKLKAKKRR